MILRMLGQSGLRITPLGVKSISWRNEPWRVLRIKNSSMRAGPNLYSLSPTEIRQIVGLIRNLSQQSKFGPTAVLVSTDFAFGIMRAMEMLLEDVTDVRPFRHENLARSWPASTSMEP